MMNKVLLDSDTISYFFQNRPSVKDQFEGYLAVHDEFCISVITYYEILNGLLYKDAKRQLSVFENFINNHQVLPLSLAVAKEGADIYARLRKFGFTIGHNDIIIAATAITYDLTLVTNNTKHYRNIPDLKLDNWS